MILSIDPGNEFSAYTMINNGFKPVHAEKIPNKELLATIRAYHQKYQPLEVEAVIEMVASYGMAVGREVFETCVWIGRYQEALLNAGAKSVTLMPRKEVKMNLCGQTKAKDSNIRQALIDRFGVVGTKKNQGWFYGFKADIWQAYALGVTYLDLKGETK